MKNTLLLFLFLGGIFNCPAQLYIADGAEVHSFSTIYLVDTTLDNKGIIIADDHIQFLGNDGKSITVENTGVFEASSVGFAGTNSYFSRGSYLSSIILEDSATLHLQDGHWDIESIIGESNSRAITGENSTYLYIQRTVETTSPFGNIGVELLSSDQNFGTTEVYRRYGTLTIGVNESISRYYEILPSTSEDISAEVKFYFTESDLNSNDISLLAPFNSTDNGSTWTEYSGSLNNVDYPYIMATSINPIDIWAFTESITLSTPEYLNHEIGLIPNPTKNVVYYKNDNNISIEGIIISDIMGKSLELTPSGSKIYVGNLSNGMYLLRFQTNLGTVVKKLIVKN